MSDTAWDDADRLRRRQGQIQDDLDVARGLVSYPDCVVAKLVSGSALGSFGTLEIQRVTGTEADGSPGILTGIGITIKAVNLGTTAPTIGIPVICHRVSHRWIFRYG